MTKDDVILNLHKLLNVVDLLPDDAYVLSAEINYPYTKPKVFLHDGFYQFASNENQLISYREPHGKYDKISVNIDGVEVFQLVDKEVDAHD